METFNLKLCNQSIRLTNPKNLVMNQSEEHVSDENEATQLHNQNNEKLVLVSEHLLCDRMVAEKKIPSHLKANKNTASVLVKSQLGKILRPIESLGASEKVEQIIKNLFIEAVKNPDSGPCAMFSLESLKTYRLIKIKNHYTSVILNYNIRSLTERSIFSTINFTTQSLAAQDLLGKMCTSSNKKITQKYIPHLVQGIKSAKSSINKQTSLCSHGNFAHEFVLPKVTNYMMGNNHNTNQPIVDLYIPSDGAHHCNYKLIPVIQAIVNDPVEVRNLRFASFNILIKCQPETTYLQETAVMTWLEQHLEISRYIHSMFKKQTILEGSYPKELCIKANKPMKTVNGVIESYTGYLKEPQADPYIPYDMIPAPQSTEAYKTRYPTKQAQTTAPEFSSHSADLESVMRNLLSSTSPESLYSQLKEIVGKLQIPSGQDTQPVNINFTIEMSHKNDKLIKNRILLTMQKPSMNSKSAMDFPHNRDLIDYQNILEEGPYQALVPSASNLPIVVKPQMPYPYSLTSVTLSGFANNAWPFILKMPVANISIHCINNMPVKTLVKTKSKTSQLRYSMTRDEQVQFSSQHMGTHYRQAVSTLIDSRANSNHNPAPFQTAAVKDYKAPRLIHPVFGTEFETLHELEVIIPSVPRCTQDSFTSGTENSKCINIPHDLDNEYPVTPMSKSLYCLLMEQAPPGHGSD